MASHKFILDYIFRQTYTMDYMQHFFSTHFNGNYTEAAKKSVGEFILKTETVWIELTKLIDADKLKLPMFCEKLKIGSSDITKYMEISINNPAFSISKNVLRAWQYGFEGTCVNFLYILHNLGMFTAFNYAADIFVKNCPSISRKDVPAAIVEPITKKPESTIQLTDLKKYDSPAMTIQFQCHTENCKNCPKIMYEPCGHLKYCVKCAMNVEETKLCPFCDTKIDQFHMVNF